MPAPVPESHDGPAVVVSAPSRALRRQLRPLVWVTLEEVALDAVADGGRLVARTSARQVAEQLGLDPGTAAAALRALRKRGLIVLEREKGPAGRFGLSVYVLGSVGGLTVLSPRTAEPHMDEQVGGRPPVGAQAVGHPQLVSPHVEKPCLAGSDGAAPELAPPHTGRPTMVRPGTAAPGVGTPSTTASGPGPATGARAARGSCGGDRASPLGDAGTALVSAPAMPRPGSARPVTGVVVSTVGVASPEGWQVSVRAGLDFWWRGVSG
jgi:DNA-binding transcriptional ArsR family regulator